jgi:carbon-monoxide dehydrogenase medium subunit
MKPARFDYLAPTEVPEALALLAEHGDGARPLAGGQSLVPLLNLRMARFEKLVDLNRIAALREVRIEDGTLVVGAMVRQATVQTDAAIRRHSPLLSEATDFIGHFQIRTRGTLGGSIAHADPTAEYPAVALALDAEVEVLSATGPRRLTVDELLDSAYVTALEPTELLSAIRLSAWGPRSGFAIDEIARRRGDFALVGAVAAIELDEAGAITRGRVVLFGVAERPVRLRSLEAGLTGSRPGEEDLDAAAQDATAALAPADDALATGAYRKRMAPVLAARVVRAALTRAGEHE